MKRVFHLQSVGPLLILGVLLPGSGCRKRSSPQPEPPTPPSKAAASAESPAPVASTTKQPPPASSAALQSVDLTPVRDAVAKYEQQFKQKPFGLPDLIRSGLLKELPKLPPGARIQYNREKGTVTVEAIQ
jgi:hypothetical protein